MALIINGIIDELLIINFPGLKGFLYIIGLNNKLSIYSAVTVAVLSRNGYGGRKFQRIINLECLERITGEMIRQQPAAIDALIM